MKANFSFIVGLASAVLASPLAVRDAATDLAALTATVKVHTANINHTLATLSAANTTSSANSSIASSNSTGVANITAEFNLIANALNSSSSTFVKRSFPLFAREDDGVVVAACNATCMTNTYTGLGALTAEIAYTAKGCVSKNAIDYTSTSSVLVKVIKGLSSVTSDLQDTVGTIAGIVVQNLNAALGTDIGGALALLITTT